MTWFFDSLTFPGGEGFEMWSAVTYPSICAASPPVQLNRGALFSLFQLPDGEFPDGIPLNIVEIPGQGRHVRLVVAVYNLQDDFVFSGIQ